ncbi:hypothetical protein NKH77_48120 [Streptomyces sp. M19]
MPLIATADHDTDVSGRPRFFTPAGASVRTVRTVRAGPSDSTTTKSSPRRERNPARGRPAVHTLDGRCPARSPSSTTVHED